MFPLHEIPNLVDIRLEQPSGVKAFLFFQQEIRVSVPSLSSSLYGHPRLKPLEFTDRQHVRVEVCKKDFLRLGGTNIGNTN